MKFGKQVPDSVLPLLVFSFFHVGDSTEHLLFQSINLLLRELDEFVAELFLIVRFH